MIPWPNQGENERPIQRPKEQPAAGKDQIADTKPKSIVRPLIAKPDPARQAPAALDLGCL
jgi:hypothetical protein